MGTNRSRHIDIRVSPEEYAAIKRRALQAGVSTSRYIRQRALQDDNRPVLRIDVTCLRDIYRALRTVSNNVNQIARVVNKTHNIQAYEDDLKNALSATENATNYVAYFLDYAHNNF